MGRPRHQVIVTKKEPLRCRVCGSTEVVYTVAYRDMDNPHHIELAGRTVVGWSETVRSCPAHVSEATAILLNKVMEVK